MKKNAALKVLDNPTYLGLIIIGLLFLSFLFSFLIRKKVSTVPQIKEGQIQIVKGDEVITINQNGLVEYRSKDRSYSETWDVGQISSFFTMMETKARNYMAKRVSGGNCGYKVFMFIDRKLVTVCMDSGDEDMAEYVEPIFIKYSGVNLTDYFGNDGTDVVPTEGQKFDGVVDFPTSTPRITRNTPTPTPYPTGGTNSNTNYAPVKAGCENWSGGIVNNRAIISNTYCTVDSTPTPAL